MAIVKNFILLIISLRMIYEIYVCYTLYGFWGKRKNLDLKLVQAMSELQESSINHQATITNELFEMIRKAFTELICEFLLDAILFYAILSNKVRIMSVVVALKAVKLTEQITLCLSQIKPDGTNSKPKKSDFVVTIFMLFLFCYLQRQPMSIEQKPTEKFSRKGKRLKVFNHFEGRQRRQSETTSVSRRRNIVRSLSFVDFKLLVQKVFLKVLLKSAFLGEKISNFCKSASQYFGQMTKVLRHRLKSVSSDGKELVVVTQLAHEQITEENFETATDNSIDELNNEDFERKSDQFFDACQKGQKEVVRQLLSFHKNEIDIFEFEQKSGNTAFHAACAGGHLSVVQQLISIFGKDLCCSSAKLLNREQKTGLELALQYGRKEVAKEIVRSIKRKFIR